MAAKSSKKVYNKPGVSDLEPFAFIQIGESKSIAADVFGGSIKATLVSLYKIRTDTVETTANDTTVVVVAIRGTASVHDWMVNLHDIKKPVAPQEAAAANVKSEFLVSFSPFQALNHAKISRASRSREIHTQSMPAFLHVPSSWPLK